VEGTLKDGRDLSLPAGKKSAGKKIKENQAKAKAKAGNLGVVVWGPGK